MLVTAGIYAMVGSLLLGGTTALIMKEENNDMKKCKIKNNNTQIKYDETQPIGKMYNIVIEDK